MRGTALAMVGAGVAVLGLGASVADADCTVATRKIGVKSIRVIQCDESAEAVDEAISRATKFCTTAERVIDQACLDAIARSFEMRRDAMLRRTLKEGASVKAAAQLYGYTEEEVERWLAENTATDRGYAEPKETPAAILQVQQDLEMLGLLAEPE